MVAQRAREIELLVGDEVFGAGESGLEGVDLAFESEELSGEGGGGVVGGGGGGRRGGRTIVHSRAEKRGDASKREEREQKTPHVGGVREFPRSVFNGGGSEERAGEFVTS